MTLSYTHMRHTQMCSGLTTTCLCAQREESVGSERAWLERRLEKALEAEQAACDRAQSLERQCETLDEEVNTPPTTMS